MMLTLILGGARSGKSSFAEKIAQKKGGDEVTYLATAEAKDEETKKRIKHHQKTRNKKWKTIEEPLFLGEVLSSISAKEVVLVDCITIFLTNHLFSNTNDSEKINYAKKENIIMDEINNALRYELITVKQVLELIDLKPDKVELILTGRGMPEEILTAADLVTEMQANISIRATGQF
mgnify:CR=1 FL=1